MTVPYKKKIKTLTQYEDISETCDSISLLLAIREVTFEHESQRYQALQALEMNRKLCTFRQRRLETLSEYLERFKNTVDKVNESNGTIGFSPTMVGAEQSTVIHPWTRTRQRLTNMNRQSAQQKRSTLR